MKPSDLKSIFPFDSIKKKTEYEIIAKNIMTILSRLGDEFRVLSKSEYIE